jgi:hypothetical protein
MGWGMGRWVLGFCAGGRDWNHGVGGGRRGREERGKSGSEPWCWPVTACFPLTAPAVDSRVAHTFQGRSARPQKTVECRLLYNVLLLVSLIVISNN